MGACRPSFALGRSGSSSTPATAKFWLDPVRLERSRGYSRKEINRIRSLVVEHQGQLLESWDEFFHG